MARKKTRTAKKTTHAKRAKPDVDRALSSLDRTVVAIPLIEEMDNKPDEPIDVIVEINLAHPHGRGKTKDAATKLIKKVSGDDAIQVVLTRYTDHYVFATLTSAQIQTLAKANEQLRYGGTTNDSPLNRVIYKIWPDFDTDLLINKSVSTVKADAAAAAFGAGGQGIVWAVVDSGIDGEHPHFEQHHNLDIEEYGLTHFDFTARKLDDESARKSALVDENGHGTHVAGIIAGESGNGQKVKALTRVRDESGAPKPEFLELDRVCGMAPKTKLVSLKVSTGTSTKTRNIIAALGFVRETNGDGYPRIHGVNISLGNKFEPEWFACGQSPLCKEVDRLVKSGTIVVVAAGNGGYGTVRSQDKGLIETGLQGTIRDPGNAALGITVGSTHRDMPHLYGASYFSAKGPTGDGRLKPDLLAPGEKIISCAANTTKSDYTYEERSGTSMAAPHVSGCAAAFLSIRREFQSKPERVKEIFLSNTTDLGREAYYQGRGLLDLMRAIQAV